ncbi:MAG TPA: Ppx/GppA phosphatase family protein [Acidimicrobiales bacterium]|nr:Ppx/GppA phosphatase family protein [Acidimicrobiales bacterium]
MRIAALDLGSNSFHLLVVEARLDGSFVPLAREREMLRLGDLVARTGEIGEEATVRAVEVIRRFRAIYESQRTDEVVALGTAALREAVDGVAFVDRVREETGVRIQVVDGVREAELIFTAIRSSVLIDPGPALAADLGGGSLEVMVGDRSGLAFAASVRLGVGRLTAELVRSDPPSASDLARVRERIDEELAPVLEEALEAKPSMLIGSSGTFVCIARIAASLRDGGIPPTINQLTVSARDIGVAGRRILGATTAERARLPGCDARRAELLPAGVAVLDALLEAAALEELTVSEWALREGIVLATIGAHDRTELADDPRALRRTSVLALCRRSSWRQRHARHVAALALDLFDHTSALHDLGADGRELLELAALLHDIGEHVSRSGHDRHTAYLIENGGLRGFSPAEVAKLSVLGRYHVRGNPKQSFESFGQLGEDDRGEVLKLLALLRLADALDAAHASLVERVRVSETTSPEGEAPHARSVELAIEAHGDAELELWTVRRKQDLFERVFGCSLVTRLVRLGRAPYDPDRVGAGLS